jgi:Zn-dependent peptidase ImmA (M78 family)
MSEEFCRARARALLDQIGATAPPIDVEKVAQSVGLTVKWMRRGANFSGRLLKERMIIEVEAPTHLHRQRFTIGHELGHYVLGHSSALGVFDDRDISDPHSANERQANIFASEILMPEALVRTHWTKLKNNQAMANLFVVSPEAMFYRLENLGLLGLEPRL